MRRAVKTIQVTEEPFGLTPTQLVVIVHLHDHERMRIGALAQALGAAQNTVSEVVTRLERSGLVVKERDPEDNRAVIVRLTAKGHGALESRRDAVRACHRALLEAMSAEERRRFAESFELMVSMAEKAREASSQARRENRRKK
jgi:MarR family transcriptional regulator, organic hydroperoxide resistance regulator